MDSVELISLAVGCGVVLVAIVLVLFRPSMGGRRSGYIDPGGDGGGGD